MFDFKKPLDQWTLGEVNQYCKQMGTSCGAGMCIFNNNDGGCVLMSHHPEYWKLVKRGFSNNELTMFRIFKEAGVTYVIFTKEDIELRYKDGHTETSKRFTGLFPSVNFDREYLVKCEVNLDEIDLTLSDDAPRK